MKNTYSMTLGWRDIQAQNRAMRKKKSQMDFWLSIIIAFLIIFVVSQLLAQLDTLIRFPLINKDFSALNIFEVKAANAASAEAIKMIDSGSQLELLPGEAVKYSVGFKNLGKKIWKKSGTGKIELKRKDSKSLAFKAALNDKENKPGQIGYFDCTLKAPAKTGTFKYKCLLAKNGKEIVKGSEFQITIKVVNKKSSQIVSNTAIINQPIITASSQTNDLTKPMGLAEICLGLGKQKFKAATLDQRLVDECLKIGIRVTDEGVSYVNPANQPVQQTATYPAPTPAPNITPTPVIVPTPTPNPTPTPTVPNPAPISSSNGPLVRIGLYSTSAPIIITANTDYKILDKNKSILAVLSAGIKATVSFNFSTQTYTFTANGTNLSTSSYLRLESVNTNNVFEIVSLEQRPAWNLSLNDNKYLGALEVRYSPNTGKLWMINELEMENYLKGLAETSNDSPLEYQKALVTAARTYAMYHYNRGTKHAAEYFTLDATYDQVYKGYNSQIRLTKVSQAVEETKGQVVTYNGEVVVTPYFSYSDGRTRNWQDVWGGSPKPWCVSVTEPAGYDKTTMYGHGVGLSAHGALHLAVYYNYTFDQILKYYYTGIELKKIY